MQGCGKEEPGGRKKIQFHEFRLEEKKDLFKSGGLTKMVR